MDFILDEMNFWAEEEIDQEVIRCWRILQTHSNIVWVCNRENTFKKLFKFSTHHNLRLDGVYQLQPCKNKRSLTVSY